MKNIKTFEEFINESINIPGIGYFKKGDSFKVVKPFKLSTEGGAVDKLKKNDTITVYSKNAKDKELTVDISREWDADINAVYDYSAIAYFIKDGSLVAENKVNEAFHAKLSENNLKLAETIFGNSFSKMAERDEDVFLTLDKNVVIGAKSLIKYQEEGKFKDFFVHSIHGNTEITFRK